MMKPIALLLLAAACGEPIATSPDAGATATDFIPPPPDAGVPQVPLRCVYLYPAVKHSGAITTAETWLGAREHIIEDDVQVKAPLKIEGCARVRIKTNKSIEVDGTGSLTTTGNGVSFQSYDSTRWGRLRIAGGHVTLTNASISGAGATLVAGTPALPAVSLESNGVLNLHGLTISSVGGVGLADNLGSIDPSSTGLTITGANDSAVTIPADLVGQLPTGSYTGNVKDEILVSDDKPIQSSTTWKNLGVPYHIIGTSGSTLNVNAPSGVAVLTIEPGTTLAFDPTIGMRIDPAAVKPTAASAALVAVGQPGLPITFTAASATHPAGNWTSLYFGGVIDSRTQVSQAVFQFGGASDMSTFQSCPTPFNSQKAEVRLEGGPQPASSFITFSTFEDSASNGIDVGYAPSGPTIVDFKATNTFLRIPFCAVTKASNNGCSTSMPTCG